MRCIPVNRFVTCCIAAATLVTVCGEATLCHAAWSPADIETELWLDAADESTITKNASDLVMQWNDKSGHDRHVSENDDSDRPIYQATGFNGDTMACLHFVSPGGAHDGRALVHNISSGNELPASDWVVFAVVNDQSDETDDDENMLLAAPAGGFDEHRVWLGDAFDGDGNNGVCIRSDSNNGGSTKAPFVAGEQQLYFALSGSASEVLRNGTQVAGNSGTYTQKPIVTRLSVGARGNTGHAGINGKIAEFLLLSFVPSEEERQKMEGYLAHKWGLEDDLPGDHPYKSAAPGAKPSGSVLLVR